MSDTLTTVIDDWALFGDTWLGALVLAGVLAQLGVAVVARGRLTLAMAAGQSAMAGCAGALWAGWATLAPGAAMAAAGSALVVGDRGRDGTLPMTLWLSAAAASLLIVAHSPHGMEEVRRMTASSLIGTTRPEVVALAILAVVVAGAAAWWGGVVRVLLIDRDHGIACGLPVRGCERVITGLLAVAIGAGLSMAGELYTAGLLILPTVAARPLVRTVGALLWVAPALALLVAASGCVVADLLDLPPAQVIVLGLAGVAGLTQGGAWVGAWAARKRLKPLAV